jgi:hypothetical protein
MRHFKFWIILWILYLILSGFLSMIPVIIRKRKFKKKRKLKSTALKIKIGICLQII